MKFKNNDILHITTKSHFHSNDREVLKKTVESICTKGVETIKKSVDFLFNIGTTNVVETSDADQIVWAIRKGRTKYSRFVKNRKPEQTKSFTIVAKKTKIENKLKMYEEKERDIIFAY
jgi:hypothetical protein